MNLLICALLSVAALAAVAEDVGSAEEVLIGWKGETYAVPNASPKVSK
ncbi:hypothetical protein TSOC_003809, partial [Tetrabaena socialis]